MSSSLIATECPKAASSSITAYCSKSLAYPLSQIRTPEEVLSDYHLAGGFRTRSVVLDPSGHLSALQSSVSRDFARGNWVRRRRDHAKNRILKQLAAIDTSDPLHDQVTGWVFPTRGHHPCAAHGGPAEPYGSAAVRCGP
jgi:hypothetical protein